MSAGAPPGHFGAVADCICAGNVVPFLGAGVNTCERSKPFSTTSVGKVLPSGAELANYLLGVLHCGVKIQDLPRAAEYFRGKVNPHTFCYHMEKVFGGHYEPTVVHKFLAGLPAVLKQKGRPPSPQLIVTTNYDGVLESAFQKAQVPYDVLTYVGDEDEGGGDGKKSHFFYSSNGAGFEPIDDPNACPVPIVQKLGAGRVEVEVQRTIILKIHGTMTRAERPGNDGIVITEKDYIRYLGLGAILERLPPKISIKIKESSLLFLGYGLKDWNVRLILHGLCQRRVDKGIPSWAVQLPDKQQALDESYWHPYNVEFVRMPLEEYILKLRRCL